MKPNRLRIINNPLTTSISNYFQCFLITLWIPLKINLKLLKLCFFVLCTVMRKNTIKKFFICTQNNDTNVSKLKMLWFFFFLYISFHYVLYQFGSKLQITIKKAVKAICLIGQQHGTKAPTAGLHLSDCGPKWQLFQLL